MPSAQTGEDDSFLGGNPALRPLRHRDFRLFWGGACLSFVGTWVQNIAMNTDYPVIPTCRGRSLHNGRVCRSGGHPVHLLFGERTAGARVRANRTVIIACCCAAVRPGWYELLYS